MTEREPKPPSPEELEAMAYVDGELDPEAARAFEARLASDPWLQREVSQLQGLAVIARQVAPPEPVDHEWARIDTDPLQRTASGAGFALALVGSLLGLAWLAWAVGTADDVPLVAKAIVLATGGGLALVFLTVLRRRLRSLPYDPYTKVKR